MKSVFLLKTRTQDFLLSYDVVALHATRKAHAAGSLRGTRQEAQSLLHKLDFNTLQCAQKGQSTKHASG